MALRPMNEFDPTKPSLVHDVLNKDTFAWKPEWAAIYREHARDMGKGVMNWDGLLLDGWEEVGRVLEFRGGK
jgi:hypothetical protein